MRQTNIVINGRFLTHAVTGVQRFARELVSAVDLRLPHYPALASLSWKIIAPVGTYCDLPVSHISFCEIGKASGHLWEQKDLLFASRNSMLINLANSGPILQKDSLTVLHDAMVFSTPGNFSRSYGLFHRTLDRILASRTQLGTVSEFSASEIERCLGVRPAIILPNGCNHLARIEADLDVCAKLGVRQNEFLLFVGSKAPNKNLSLVLDAIRQLGPDSPKFVIVGAADKRVLRDEALLTTEAVIFAQRLSDAEICGLYRSAIALIFPSKYEGFGIPALEAMSLGCPALVSDIPSTREVCGSAALYFNCESPESLNRCISRLSENPCLREEMIKRGAERAKMFSWTNTADVLLQHLDRLLCRR